jgi:16S rRNA (cytidine1402-2'-O)-methyltransferase
MSGNLYVVATPIGNLKDITLRAMETLMSVDFILCEDARTTQVLLKSIDKDFLEREKKPKLIPFYEAIEVKIIGEVIDTLKNGFNIAVISDAGTPTISDPGFKLIREAIENKIKVISVPGPSAVISALVSSGLPTDKFLFLGFLPKKSGHRKTMFENLNKSLKIINSTVIIYESPHRLIKTLNELKLEFGDIEVVVARELTKMYEEIRKDLISNQIKHFENGVKGEIVLLFNLK